MKTYFTQKSINNYRRVFCADLPKDPDLRYIIALERIEKKVDEISPHIKEILPIKNKIKELTTLLRMTKNKANLEELKKTINDEIGNHLIGIAPIKIELNQLLKLVEENI